MKVGNGNEKVENENVQRWRNCLEMTKGNVHAHLSEHHTINNNNNNYTDDNGTACDSRKAITPKLIRHEWVKDCIEQKRLLDITGYCIELK